MVNPAFSFGTGSRMYLDRLPKEDKEMDIFDESLELSEASIEAQADYLDSLDRLEEIKLRDAKIRLENPIGARMIACSDRRWLLAEVDAQREELGRLRAALEEIADFKVTPYHPAVLARRALEGAPGNAED